MKNTLKQRLRVIYFNGCNGYFLKASERALNAKLVDSKLMSLNQKILELFLR